MRETERTIARVRYALVNIFSIKADVFFVGRSFGAIRKQYDILRIYRLSVLSQQRAQLDVCDYVTSKKNGRQISLIS